ncbi:bromodomain testis-specific protein, partial [Thalictrum thalictroides]
DDDLRIILESSGSLAKEAVKKYSDEMFGKLGDMEQQLEKYLDVIMSNCRKMTNPEKQQLRKLIQNLPLKNLDRVVDIIVKHREMSGPCNEIHINLGNEDNGTLWRLYYYVEAVARASNLS